MQKIAKLPEWLRVGVVVLLMLVAGWLTVAKKLLIPQTSIQEETPSANPKTQQYKMTIGTKELLVEVRRTAAEQGLGLSWRTSMEANEGMVFIYNQPQRVLYWMRGMQFPLDFLWVRQGKVVEMTAGVLQPTKEGSVPQTVSPENEVDMVIEVNAGWIAQQGIKLGDEVSISY